MKTSSLKAAAVFAAAGALLAFGASAASASTATASAATASAATARTATVASPHRGGATGHKEPGTPGPAPVKNGRERLAAGLAPPRIVNLHREYQRALRHVRPEKISGITFPRGKQPKVAARASAGCSEPDCPLTYNGGPVQHHPRVYLVMWGPNWQTDSAATYLENFYGGLGAEPQDNWSTITAQYGDGTGYPSFSGSTLVSAVIDLSTPPPGVTQNQLAAEAETYAAWFGISDVTNSQIVIATQSGTWPQCFNGVNCTTSGVDSTPYCAWHSSAGDPAVPYINLPYQPDAGASCGWSLFGPDNGFSIVGGHEYAETITDPYQSAWFDSAGGGSGAEIGDKCAWQNLGTVTLSTGTFEMQPLWSNGYGHNASGCILSSPPEDTVTVANPGNRSGTAGSPVNLPVAGTSSGGYQLAWSATGLPPGLSVNPASGVISGTPTTPGEFTTTVTASDMSGASDWAQWTWQVGPDSVTVTNPGTRSGSVGIATSLQAQGSSIEGYPLTSWSAQGLPPGLSISSAGLVSGTPATAGTYPVSLTATDAAGTAGSATFTWTISADGVVVTNPGLKVSLLGRAAGLQIKATSSQGYPLTYRATGLPPGLGINATTGWISGTVTTTGGYSVTVTATDSAGESGSATFTWDVASLPPPCGRPYTRTGPGGEGPGARASHDRIADSARSHLPIC